MDTSIKKKTINGLLFKTIERVLIQGISLIISIILARILMPEDYGNVALLLVIITLLEVIIANGFGAALIQKKDADILDFSTCFYFSVVFSIILYCIIYVTSPLLASFYGNDGLSIMIKIIGLKIILSGINSIQNAYIAKNFLFRKSMFISAIATVISGFCGIYMAYKGFGEWALIVQTLFSSFLLVALTLIFIKVPLKFVFSFNRLKILFSFGWKLMAVGFLNTGYDELRSLIIGKRYSSTDLALYDKGRNFPKLISNNINSIIDGVIFSTMSYLQDSLSKVKSTLSRSIKMSLYILSPMLIGLALVSHELIMVLYTAKWEGAAFYLEILSFSFVLIPFITLNMNALKSIGKSGLLLKIDIFRKIVGIVLIVVSSFFGVKYIALSVLVGSLFGVVVYMIAAKMVFNYQIKNQALDIIMPLIPSIFMGICIFSIEFLQLSSLASLFIKIAVGIIAFLFFSFVTKNESFIYLCNVIRQKLRKTSD